MTPVYIQSKITDRIFGPYLWTREAARKRLVCYFRWTLPSLLRQTVPVVPWLSAVPGSEAELADSLPALQEAGVLVTFDHGKAEAERLGRENVRWADVFRMDTDDILFPQAIETLLEARGGNPASLLTRGYAWWPHDGDFRLCDLETPNFQMLRREIIQGMWCPAWQDPHTIFRWCLRPALVTGRHYLYVRHAGEVSWMHYNPDWKPPETISAQEADRIRDLLRLGHEEEFWAGHPTVLEFLATEKGAA